MAKLILMYGVHLNEKPATEEMAKKLKPALEKRGYEVELVEFPPELTLQSLVAKGKQTRKEEEWQSYHRNIRREFKQDLLDEMPDAILLDIHSTPDFQMGDSLFKKPRKFRARNILLSSPSEVIEVFIGGRGKRFYLEIPAKYVGSRPNWRESARGMERSLRQYFESEIDLKKTRGANYLAPIIVRKLAHLIDTAIKTSQGFYRPPRRGKIPFRTRPKNPRRATPEQHHIK